MYELENNQTGCQPFFTGLLDINRLITIEKYVGKIRDLVAAENKHFSFCLAFLDLKILYEILKARWLFIS